MAEIDDDGILRAFGGVALSFFELEEALAWHTAKIIDPVDHGVGLATLAGLDFRKILEIFETLVLERTSWRYIGVKATKRQAIRNRLAPVVKAIEKVRGERNHVFHAYWRPSFTYDADSDSFIRTPGAAESTRHQKKSKQGHVDVRRSWTLNELQKLSADIEGAARQLNDFVTWANTQTNLFPEESD